MKPSDGFGIVIRTIGLLFVMTGIAYGVTIATLFLGSESSYQGYGMVAYVLCFLACCTLGLYFLRGGSHIVRFAYPETKE